MKVYEIRQFGIENLTLAEREIPRPSENEVLVKFHAVSLNYRDLLMVSGKYNPNLKTPIVPCSDGAGEIVEIGKQVRRWKVGDRVMPTFMQGWIDGEIEYKKARTALGGDLDGCLREFGTFHEEGLVRIPEGFSYEEAATLPCAALTAYNALFISGNLKPDETVLTQGTGGVSIFALQFAKAVGAKVFITSSNNEKLQKAQNLGANELINYKETPDWDEVVLKITQKRGVDHIVELGGAGTLQKSLRAVKMGGYIAVIGVLAGKGEFDPVLVLMKAVRLQGIFVGSREMFEKMNEFIEKHKIKPVIDKIFEFDNAIEAFRFMKSGAHFGKIVIKLAK
jgi:NADPH:quinone reductase-like Zn-dependent oxidoreductase